MDVRFDSLKSVLLKDKRSSLETFLGYKISEKASALDVEEAIDEVYIQMPQDTFDELYAQLVVVRAREEMARLDYEIFTTYFPEEKNNAQIAPLIASQIWLKIDLAAVFKEAKNFEETKEDVVSRIQSSPLGDVILKEYISMDKIIEHANIRRDFAAAFKKYKSISDISCGINFSISSSDPTQLAMLHKANRFRTEIEDLLTDCNFHEDCDRFITGNYESYL